MLELGFRAMFLLPFGSTQPLGHGIGTVLPHSELSQAALSLWDQELWAGLQHELGERDPEGSTGEERNAVQTGLAPSCLKSSELCHKMSLTLAGSPGCPTSGRC